MIRFIKVILLGIILFTTGCATMVTGTTQIIPVKSDPSDATIKVDGKVIAVTPGQLELDRKRDHNVEISKDGFRTRRIILSRTLNPAGIFNPIPIVGLIVDMETGANWYLTPKEIDIKLEKTLFDPSTSDHSAANN